jgi:hypothetical protein
MVKLRTDDIEVKLKEGRNRTVIDGKTAVPFKTLVQLVLQRKVLELFKKWGDEHVIISSELLTTIASAPQDSQENRSHLIIVTLGVGMLAGIFLFAVLQMLASPILTLGNKELFLISAGLLLIAFLAAILSRTQRGSRGQKLADSMERIASLLSK